MFNEAFARAVLAERAREREAALFLKRLNGYEPACSRGWVGRSPIAYVRGIAASVVRVVVVRPWRAKRGDDSCVLAEM
jgi:hypothetical protein